jgi:hypothetical protein
VTVTNPADLVQEACDLLADILPRLARETAEPSAEGPAPGMHARAAAAPLPGNAPAFYARTGIDATARQLEGVLKYAAGARRPGPLAVRGGSAANTLGALDAICGLIAVADDDLYRLVITELEQRLNEARQVRAIDEAERWRPVPSRACPYRCFFLKVLIDSRGQPAGRVGCFGHLPSGEPCRAGWASLAEIAQDLERAEAMPDLDG